MQVIHNAKIIIRAQPTFPPTNVGHGQLFSACVQLPEHLYYVVKYANGRWNIVTPHPTLKKSSLGSHFLMIIPQEIHSISYFG